METAIISDLCKVHHRLDSNVSYVLKTLPDYFIKKHGKVAIELQNFSTITSWFFMVLDGPSWCLIGR